MSIYQLSKRIGLMLTKYGMTLGICESCTGGMFGCIITDVAGSSDYFKGGVISYANDVKVRMVGVRSATIKHHGAVSRATAREMARGVRDQLQSSIGLSITGIAGPSGGTRAKPVGRVFISIAIGEKVIVQEYTFRGSRKDIRKQACVCALKLLDTILQQIHNNPEDTP